MVIERIVAITINIISTFTAFFVCIKAWARRDNTGRSAALLSMSMLATTIYAFGYTMELSSNNLDSILFWIKIEHVGIQLIAPTWLLFTHSLTGRLNKLKIWQIVLLYFIPIILMFSVFGGYFHQNPYITPDAPFPTLSYEKNFFSWLSIMMITIYMIVSFSMFSLMVLSSERTFKKQAVYFSIGAALPLFGMFLTAFSLSPYNLDLAPTFASLSGVFLLLGFQRYQILDITPLARAIIFDGMADGYIVLNLDDRIIDLNKSSLNTFPSLLTKAVGKKAEKVFIDYPELVSLIVEGKENFIELEVRNNDTSIFYRCHYLPLQDSQGRHLGKVINLHNYTHIKNLLAQLSNQATVDALTNTYNRRHFYELADKEMSRAQRYRKQLSMIMFDIDQYKEVNDTYGHAAGDLALTTVIDICKRRLRKYDILGRYGGDEFLLLLPETSSENAYLLAEELRATLEITTVEFGDYSFPITASFGVSGDFKPGEISLEKLVECVDKAVYKAKEDGRNCTRICSPDEFLHQE